jgi:ferric-dicitrate binding protein FerR (iron transport regulator)
LISPAAGFCQTGRLSARVPPAGSGFTLGTPAVAVTDLGTAFGLVVSDTRPTEVHVFEGQVEVSWLKATEPAQRLGAGEGLLIKAGITKNLPARPKAFLSEEQFARRAGQPPLQSNPPQ